MIDYNPVIFEQIAPEKIPSWKKGIILYNAGINALKKEKRELAYWLFRSALLEPNLSPEVLYLAHLYAGEMEAANIEYCNYRMLMGAADCKGLMLVKIPTHAVHENNPISEQLDGVIKKFGNGEDGSGELSNILEKIKQIPSYFAKQCADFDFREAQPKFDQAIERGIQALSSFQSKQPLPYTMVMLYLMREALNKGFILPKRDPSADPAFSESLETLDLMEALDFKPKSLPAGGEGW